MPVSRDRGAFCDMGADRRSAARNMRRAGVPENTIMKIAGWKTPSMFRRYDIQDGKDIQRAGKTMEKWIAARKAATTAASSDSTSALQACKSKHVNLVSKARYTSPMPPLPSGPRIS
jgi:hypothetical protein